MNSAVLLDFSNLVNLSMQQVLISSCALEQFAFLIHSCKDFQLQKVQIRNAESIASLIVFSSDGSEGYSNIQCYHLEFDDTQVSRESFISVECQQINAEMNFLVISNMMLGERRSANMKSNTSLFKLKLSSFQNTTRYLLIPYCFASLSSSLLLELENCSNKKCASPSEKGSIVALADLADASMSSCVFDGAASAPELRANDER
ncbi:uncharacterized protein MONOS_17210 [Monocercomonoides exilis]|uniref:uncharacterized protein n=1 Tax=Monocercomonoides exilis TaxID=2049356 RepID=UPI00355A5C89|nr:hypothetical protein MONOS_17210 [Monocercomonoides exilis]